MKKLIKEILEKLACKHKWEIVHKARIDSNWYGQYIIFLFCCQKCGKFKKENNL